MKASQNAIGLIREEIVETALSFVGEEEIAGNMGFKNKDFEDKMRTVGFQDTHAWCTYFAELVWKYAYAKYDSTKINKLDRLFSASAVQTYKNVVNSDFDFSRIPEPGDVVIWRNYKDHKPHWTGHAGIVIEYDEDRNFINTVEGNSNNDGSREGKEVVIKSRGINFKPKQSGLVMMGFIKPIL